MFTIYSLYIHRMFTKRLCKGKVKNLTPKNGGSFMQVFAIYFHYVSTICSPCIYYMFTMYLLGISNMLTICIPNMFTICIPYMFTIYSLYIHHMFNKGLCKGRAKILTPENGGSFIQVFTVYFHYVFTVCYMFTMYFLCAHYVHYEFSMGSLCSL